MAGSYLHILHGWSLIENLGDASEAVEELMWLVESEIGEARARQLLSKKLHPMMRGEVEKDEHFERVEILMKT